MLVPGLTLLVIFGYYPMYGVRIAFQKYNPGLGFTRSPWVGLDNFRFAFAMPSFRQLVWNTLRIAVAKIVTVQLCAVALALMLNEVRSILVKRTVQTLVYLPYFLSWVVLAGVLRDILATQTGIVNQTIQKLGIEPILFLGSNKWFVPTLIVSNLWKVVGWSTIIYLAALTGVDPVLYEAAAIDGAGRWKRMVHVTLPGIGPTVVLIACLQLGSVLNAGFDQILNLYSPVVYRTGDVLSTYVYRAGLVSAQYSLASAIGLLKSAIGFLLIVLAYWLANRYAGYRVF
jgi:putative aldouronate transport system permease protein